MATKTVMAVIRSGLKWVNSLSDRSVNLKCPIWTATAPDGETISFDSSLYPVEILQQLLIHGRSKIHDAAALRAEDFPNSKIPNLARFDAMAEVHLNLAAGVWNPGRESQTPEQKYAALRERVRDAWISLDAEKRDAAEFEKAIVAHQAKLAALGNSGVTENLVVESLAKNAKIIGAMALLANAKPAVDVEEMV